MLPVEVDDVTIGAGTARLLDGVSFRCCEGEWTLVHGPSGAGKSTLLRAINGLRVPDRGRISVLGTAIPGRSRWEARRVWRQTGTVLQSVALFETKTARQNVELALRTTGVPRGLARQRAGEWLARLRLESKVDEYPARLSGGECQRVALARALAVAPRLLVLDEPTSALDRETAQAVLDGVRELVAQGTTVVMSSHRVEEVFDICDQRVALCSGRIAAIERGAVRMPGARAASRQQPPVSMGRKLFGERTAS